MHVFRVRGHMLLHGLHGLRGLTLRGFGGVPGFCVLGFGFKMFKFMRAPRAT